MPLLAERGSGGIGAPYEAGWEVCHGLVVVVVGLQVLHLHWYGLEHRSDPPTPLLTTAPLGGMKTGTGGTLGAPIVFSR